MFDTRFCDRKSTKNPKREIETPPKTAKPAKSSVGHLPGNLTVNLVLSFV